MTYEASDNQEPARKSIRDMVTEETKTVAFVTPFGRHDNRLDAEQELFNEIVRKRINAAVQEVENYPEDWSEHPDLPCFDVLWEAATDRDSPLFHAVADMQGYRDADTQALDFLWRERSRLVEELGARDARIADLEAKLAAALVDKAPTRDWCLNAALREEGSEVSVGPTQALKDLVAEYGRYAKASGNVADQASGLVPGNDYRSPDAAPPKLTPEQWESARQAMEREADLYRTGAKVATGPGLSVEAWIVERVVQPGSYVRFARFERNLHSVGYEPTMAWLTDCERATWFLREEDAKRLAPDECRVVLHSFQP
jgi:hypothetical protein